jgi:predicted GIY-YIG superfamily endonuclease
MVKTIYTLALEGGHFYVGSSGSMGTRMESHFDGGGSAWTRKFKAVQVHHTYVCDDAAFTAEENKQTAQMMIERGVNMVRGGQYSRCEPFTSSDVEHLTSFIGHHLSMNFAQVRKLLDQDRSMASDQASKKRGTKRPPEALESLRCGRCGRSNHTAEGCYAKTNAARQPIEDDQSHAGEEEEEEDEAEAILLVSQGCMRCGRSTHTAEKCYARTTAGGQTILDVSEDTYESEASAPVPPSPPKKFKGKCTTCGNFGHWASTCFKR